MTLYTIEDRIGIRAGRFAGSLLTAFSLFACLASHDALAQDSSNKIPAMRPAATASNGLIKFPAGLVPKIPSSLPTVKLTASAPPEAFLRDTLGKIGVNLANIQPLSHTTLLPAKGAPEQLLGVVEQDHLRAVWHRQTGEAQIFPQFETLHPAPFIAKQDPHLAQAVTLAKQVLANPDILPKDDTRYIVGDARPVVGSTAQFKPGAAPSASQPQLYLSYVPLQRTVNGFKVYGPGSRAAIAVGAEGGIQGFVKSWKTGSLAASVKEKRNAAQVRAALAALLQPMTKDSDVTVLSVEIAYYDNNGDAMLPLYRAISRLHPHASKGAPPRLLGDDDYLATYLAYGDGRLPPELTPASGPLPIDAPKKVAAMEPEKIAADDPTVGMYVVRDAPSGANPSSGFVAEANGFWNGLQSSSGASQFTKAQYFWAVPELYTTDEASFVNSVNIALTEAHGAPWLFTTESNCCDTVNINAIPASQGYGSVNHGKLNFWIIHSCSVVPSAEDNSAWWMPWFKVFQGLHAVMGSRTEMYFDGGAVNQPFGQSIGNGASVISAWFNATLSYYPASRQPPIDRPSAVTVCGHEPDTVFNPAPLSAPNCLTNYWQPN